MFYPWKIANPRFCSLLSIFWSQAQRARGKLIREVRDSFNVDAFVGSVTDWEKVCIGNLVGMPVVVLPTGFKIVPDASSKDTRRRTAVITGIYAPPERDHIVRPFCHSFH